MEQQPRPRHGWLIVVLAVLGALAVNFVLPGVITRSLLPRPDASVAGRTPAVTTNPTPSTPTAPSPTTATPTPAPTTATRTPTRTPTPTRTATTGAVQPSLATLSRGVVLIEADASGGTSNGTGMVISPDGLVVTNYHVVQGTEELSVTLALTKVTYQATVVGSAPDHDVALLQLQDAANLDTVRFDPDPVQLGDRVIQVGNSGGQGYLDVATGTVTDLDTRVSVKDDLSDNGRSTLEGVVASTAAAVPGDSGGPMFDAEGEVLGMTAAGNQENATTSGQTITFHIPWPTVLRVADDIRNGENRGTVRVGGRAFLGVTLADSGLVVATVVDGGPADTAGITPGATITTIAGVEVRTRIELYQVLSGLTPRQVVPVAWVDPGGRTRTAEVTLTTSPTN